MNYQQARTRVIAASMAYTQVILDHVQDEDTDAERLNIAELELNEAIRDAAMLQNDERIWDDPQS